MLIEARYFVSDNNISLFLGRRLISTESMNIFLLNQQNVYDLIHYYEYIFISNPIIRPGPGAIVKAFYEDPNDNFIIINFWLSKNPIFVFPVYIGYVTKLSDKNLEGYNVHTWTLSYGANFIDPKYIAFIYINNFLQNEQKFPQNEVLTLNMETEYVGAIPYLEGSFRKISEYCEHDKKSMKNCPSDYYPVELSYLYRGYFIWVRKTAWNKRIVTNDDLIFYDA